MAAPWLWTAKEIINAAAVECGLAEAIDPYTSGDANFKQLRALLKTAGHELTQVRDWPVLVKEHTITGDGSNTLFTLPADFLRMKDDAGWNRTAHVPLLVTPSQEWQALRAVTSTPAALRVLYRVAAEQIQVFEPLPLNHTVVFEYVSRYWVQSAGAAAPDRYHPETSTDLIVLEPLLMVRALSLKFKLAKGLEATGAAVDYARALESAAGSAPQTTLSVSGRRSSINRLLSGSVSVNTGGGTGGGGGAGGFDDGGLY